MLYFHAATLGRTRLGYDGSYGGDLLSLLAVAGCFSLLSLAVSRCYFAGAQAKKRGFLRRRRMASLFFCGNNSENSGAAICHLVHRDNYYPRDRHGRLVPWAFSPRT